MDAADSSPARFRTGRGSVRSNSSYALFPLCEAGFEAGISKGACRCLHYRGHSEARRELSVTRGGPQSPTESAPDEGGAVDLSPLVKPGRLLRAYVRSPERQQRFWWMGYCTKRRCRRFSCGPLCPRSWIASSAKPWRKIATSVTR